MSYIEQYLQICIRKKISMWQIFELHEQQPLDISIYFCIICMCIKETYLHNFPINFSHCQKLVIFFNTTKTACKLNHEEMVDFWSKDTYCCTMDLLQGSTRFVKLQAFFKCCQNNFINIFLHRKKFKPSRCIREHGVKTIQEQHLMHPLQ